MRGRSRSQRAVRRVRFAGRAGVDSSSEDQSQEGLCCVEDWKCGDLVMSLAGDVPRRIVERWAMNKSHMGKGPSERARFISVLGRG